MLLLKSFWCSKSSLTFPAAGHALLCGTSLTHCSMLQAAHMINCQVAIALQEDFTLTYGRGIGLQKDYHVHQLMFNTGVNSGGGHFITAIRLQRDGRYQPGDMWQLFSSADEPCTLSLAYLDEVYSKYLNMMLMTAKEQPADDMRPLLQAPSRPRYILFLQYCCYYCCLLRWLAGRSRSSCVPVHPDSIFGG